MLNTGPNQEVSKGDQTSPESAKLPAVRSDLTSEQLSRATALAQAVAPEVVGKLVEVCERAVGELALFEKLKSQKSERNLTQDHVNLLNQQFLGTDESFTIAHAAARMVLEREAQNDLTRADEIAAKGGLTVSEVVDHARVMARRRTATESLDRLQHAEAELRKQFLASLDD